MSDQDEHDFLDEVMAESEAKSPGFSARVDDAVRRRVMGRALSERRQALGLSQTEVARRMRTSQPAVSRLEAGADVRVSTLTRYLEVVGIPANWPERITSMA
jgi:DNA-binding transcriptional regulator YiaG